MRTIIIPTALVGLSVLTLAACASGDETTDTSPTPEATATAEAAAPAVEHSSAQTRITVAYADGVEVFDLVDGELSSVGTFETEGEARVVAGPDSRHVYLVDGEGGQTTVLDAGSYAQGHGDHYHYYTRDAAMRPDVIEGDTPVHVVGHDGRLAIFHDGSGEVAVFDEIGHSAGGLVVETFQAELAHHGVAVPIHDGVLITESDDGGLPASIRQIDNEGNDVTTYENVCPGLHGEATIGEWVAFGCSDGVVLIDPEEQTSTSIAYPADAGETRVGSLYATDDSLVGNWGSEGFAVIDIDDETITPVDVGAPVGAIARGVHDEVLVLTTDGRLHVIDEDGEHLYHVEAMDAFELPEGHGGARPAIVAADDYVVLSDVAGSRLVVIDAHDWTEVSELALDGEPTGIVATGLSPEPHGGHDDEAHDDHDHDDHGDDHEHDDHDHDDHEHDDHDHHDEDHDHDH